MDNLSGDTRKIFNVPGVIIAFIAVFAAIHFYRSYLTDFQDFKILSQAGFSPARFFLAAHFITPDQITSALNDGSVRSSMNLWLFAALNFDVSVWSSPLTYAFLHGDNAHIILNSLWFLAFGSVVARRLGTVFFLIFFIAAAIFSAIIYGFLHQTMIIPMIGASGVVSAAMSAALLMPQEIQKNSNNQSGQLMPLRVAFRDKRVLATSAIWISLNLLYAVGVTRT
jgi:membrane associated rhomboid family serine protease